MPELVEATIETDGCWTLSFRLAVNAEQEFRKMGFSTQDQKKLARGIFEHELGHWEICPHDIGRKYHYVEAIAQVCRRYNQAKDLAKQIVYFANVFSDMVVNTVIASESLDSEYADAMLMFMLISLRNNETVSPRGNLIARLYTQLYGQGSSYANEVVNRLPQDSPKALDEALRLFPYRDEPERLASWLRDHKNWSWLAAELARILLLQQDDDDAESLSSGSSSLSAFHDVLTTLYEGRAANVQLAFSEGAVGTVEWPVSPLFVKPVEPRHMPELQHINWPQTRIYPRKDGSWELQLQQTDLYVATPLRSDASKGILPDLSFWIDSSGSMCFDPYSGRGEYDLVLRTIFGVFEWLKRGRVIDYLNYSVLTFSSSTRYSGWRRWHDRKSIYSALFNYQGGGTRLNTAMMRRCIREAPRPFVAIMITDGCLEEDILPDISAQYSGGKSFVLIQIGKTSQLASRLEEAGFPVYLISNVSELKGLVLRVVLSRYI